MLIEIAIKAQIRFISDVVLAIQKLIHTHTHMYVHTCMYIECLPILKPDISTKASCFYSKVFLQTRL